MSSPRNYVCGRAALAPTIDGRLDKPFWKDAPWTDDFVDIEGDLRPAPQYRTRARMLWDDRHLYIGAEMEEPHVWGTIMEHNAVIFHDNDFEVFLDPDGDNHNYYEIEINALNTRWDLNLVKPYRDGGPAVNQWDVTGFLNAVHIDGTLNDPGDTDRLWSVEMAIPWHMIRKYTAGAWPPGDGERWRINFSRVEWDVAVENGSYVKIADRPEHNWVWSPQGVIDMHQPERWGTIQFSDAAPGVVPFSPDSAEPVRDLLMATYHAQKAFHKRHARWAADLSELDLSGYIGPNQHPGNALSGAELHAHDGGWRATAVCSLPGGGQETWSVREDSLLTKQVGSPPAA